MNKEQLILALNKYVDCINNLEAFLYSVASFNWSESNDKEYEELERKKADSLNIIQALILENNVDYVEDKNNLLCHARGIVYAEKLKHINPETVKIKYKDSKP